VDLDYRSAALSVLTPVDPNERYRRRRRRSRRTYLLRRAVALAMLVVFAAGFAFGAKTLARDSSGPERTAATKPAVKTQKSQGPRLHHPVPKEIRGVHVTMALAGLEGKLAEYVDLRHSGLNTIELDDKDENGDIGFTDGMPQLAKTVGAARPYYDGKAAARQIHKAGLYLIGRVVSFEDPVLSRNRPGLALQNPDGSVWKTAAGLGWINPYDRRNWHYLVAVGEAAARAGFDEIQFDYVRFPSDGDVESIVFPVRQNVPKGKNIANFLEFAATRLHKLGVRVSADVFGLAATRDLGIGQKPARIAKFVDAIYPMVYPSHFNSGEYGLPDPNANPSQTVTDALLYFETALRGSDAHLVPWLQDFSLGRTYTPADVQAQVDAARSLETKGFLLWNPLGLYTPSVLAGS
jgi:hypothetical protein